MQTDVWGLKDLKILRIEDIKTNTAYTSSLIIQKLISILLMLVTVQFLPESGELVHLKQNLKFYLFSNKKYKPILENQT